MKKRILILSSVLGLLAVSAIAGQQVLAHVIEAQTVLQMESALLPGLPGQGHGDRRVVHRLLQRLGAQLELTLDQKTQIKGILETERPKLQPLILQTVASHKAIIQTTQNGEFDEAQVRTLAAQQAQNLAALIVEKVLVKTQI
jgi:Spy/CpxP family protein refolding chaperone